MSRLVLDTNCLIQIVLPRSKYHFLWDSFVRGEILFVSLMKLLKNMLR